VVLRYIDSSPTCEGWDRGWLPVLDGLVTPDQGRFVRGMAIDAPRPAIHMLLRADSSEGSYPADVGFGNLGPTRTLLLEPEIEQETAHELMRFIDVGDERQPPFAASSAAPGAI